MPASTYPISVLYCKNCGLPYEFCEYGGAKYEACKPFIAKYAPHLLKTEHGGGAGSSSASASTTTTTVTPSGTTNSATNGADGITASMSSLNVGAGAGSTTTASSSAATSTTTTRVKAASSDDEGAASKPQAVKTKGGKVAKQQVIIEVKEKGKRRKVTTVSGLDSFGVKLKDAASALGKKFGAGATVGKSASGVPEVDVQGDVAYDLPDILAELYDIPENAIIVRGE